MTNRELQELLGTHDPEKRVMFLRDLTTSGNDAHLTMDDIPYNIEGIESFEDVLLLTTGGAP